MMKVMARELRKFQLTAGSLQTLIRVSDRAGEILRLSLKAHL